MAAGCNMVIQKEAFKSYKKLFKNGKATWFYSKTSPKTKKKMDLPQIKTKGSIIVDDGAEIALRKRASYFLLGLLKLKGFFLKVIR